MRTTHDRIRHAISFEIIGLLLVIPLGSIGFGIHIAEIGVVAIFAATIATVWNYLYNLLFDKALMQAKGNVQKTLTIRIIHATLFEAGLLAVTLPFIAYFLGIGLWQAFLMDVAFAVFYLVYAFVFNWIYDVVFPLSPQC